MPFENEGDRKVHTGYYLPEIEIKDYINFDQSVELFMVTYDNI